MIFLGHNIVAHIGETRTMTKIWHPLPLPMEVYLILMQRMRIRSWHNYTEKLKFEEAEGEFVLEQEIDFDLREENFDLIK